MERRKFISNSLAACSLAAATSALAVNSAEGSQAGHLNPPAKKKGRLSRAYRVMWDQNHGKESYHNPPIDPIRQVQAHLGFFEGTPVDAYVCALGPDCGYSVAYPTQVKGLDFILDRYNRGAKLGDVRYWRHAENLKAFWARGIDPLGIQVEEARRLGIDFWFRLSMNDWHSSDEDGAVYRLSGSQFFADHPEYRIGVEGAKGWPSKLARAAAPLQDFAHAAVRQLRLDTMEEACGRYDVDGFVYDFMRCPVYFKFGEEENGMPIMTEFIRQARAILDRIGAKKGKQLGLAVRVPNTIAGTRRLGFDISAWVTEHLVDIVIPSTFFAADLEEDMGEWVELARNTPVRIYPAIEESYRAGHTGGIKRLGYNPPVLLPLKVEMINAIALRHLNAGVDGLYTFNWFGTVDSYDYDNREALDNIGCLARLRHKNKCYLVMRSDGSFPNCLPDPRQIPAKVGRKSINIHMVIADDLAAAGDRLRAVRLNLHLANLTVVDRMEVALNGHVLSCSNPMQPGQYKLEMSSWQSYDVSPKNIRLGANVFTLQMIEQNERLLEELPIEVSDLELVIEYHYPSGPWLGYNPRL